jgi:NAD+ synthase
VVALARSLGVAQDVIEAPPSGGLWEGQTDEGEMGVTYDQIETWLRATAEAREPRLPADVVSRIQRLASASEHKRRPPAAFVEVRQFLD